MNEVKFQVVADVESVGIDRGWYSDCSLMVKLRIAHARGFTLVLEELRYLKLEEFAFFLFTLAKEVLLLIALLV